MLKMWLAFHQRPFRAGVSSHSAWLLGTTLKVAYPTPSQKDYYDNSPRELSSVSTYIRVSLRIFPFKQDPPPNPYLGPRNPTHPCQWGISPSPAESTNNTIISPQ